MKWFKPQTTIVLACLWVVALFFIITSGLATEDMAIPQETESTPIIIPRGLYQESFEVAFEGETRDLWQKPDQVIEALGDLNGLTIADIGCGEGYFTRRLAKAVGPQGHVYATDIQKEVLHRMTQSLEPELAPRVIPILADEQGLGIKEPVDLVVLIQVLGEVPDQRAFLTQIKKIMKPDSRLVLIDSKHITDPETGFARPQNLSRLRSDLEQENLVVASQPPQFLPKQFMLILRKKLNF